MNKQKIGTHSVSGNSGGDAMTEDRYYVQSITDRVFVIRERVSDDGDAESKNRIVKSFDMRHDAYTHADMLNEQQRKLDAEKQEG